MLKSLRLGALSLPLVLAVAACGNTPGERAVTGGLIGAGGGAVVGSATGIGVIPGAVVGGLGGAAIGAATAPRCDDYNNYCRF
jgi:osmotically inducible lipoprotein OsmB